jgi:hypothetical protein
MQRHKPPPPQQQQQQKLTIKMSKDNGIKPCKLHDSGQVTNIDRIHKTRPSLRS